MAGISFVDRKNGYQFDAGFHLWDAGEFGDVSSWHVGDVVSVCFPDQADKLAAIREYQPAAATGVLLQIECVVVRRSHSVIWRDVGKFDSLTTCNVTLEAKDGFWEDVLAWVIINKKPSWVE